MGEEKYKAIVHNLLNTGTYAGIGELIGINTGKNSTYESIQKEIKPSKGKVIYFNGKYFHTCRWCKEGQRRIICIFTFN